MYGCMHACMIMNTKQRKIPDCTKAKIEPQIIYILYFIINLKKHFLIYCKTQYDQGIRRYVVTEYSALYNTAYVQSLLFLNLKWCTIV